MKPIEMNIPHAADARRTIEKGEYEKAIVQAKKIETLIQEAISKGQSRIHGTGTLEPSIKIKLDAMGYSCTGGSQYNENYWSVSWT